MLHSALRGRTLAAGLAVGLGLAGAEIANAQATSIGPGINLAQDNGVDGGGGRINVDLSNAPILPAGTYTATRFNYDAGIAGDVTPFLATANGNGTYTAIAVGTDQAVAGAAQDQSVAFGGSDFFILAAPTRVFAGIASDTQNPIILDDGVPSTDHEGGGQAASTYVITLGGLVPGDGSFSNANLGRVYAFSIDAVIPEPSTLGLAALGLGFLGCRMRRR